MKRILLRSLFHIILIILLLLIISIPKTIRLYNLTSVANKLIINNSLTNIQRSIIEKDDMFYAKLKTNEINNSSDIVITKIRGLDLKNESRLSNTIITLLCKIDFSYSINNKSYSDTTTSNIIFLKDGDTYSIQSIDDVFKDIFKIINENNFKDLQALTIINSNPNNLIYNSDILNISFSYPDYFNYSSSKGNSTLEGNYETITLSSENNEYIKLYFQENSTLLGDEVSKLESANYKILNENKQIGDMKFIVLENTFVQNNILQRETVYLSKNKFSDVSFLTITTNSKKILEPKIEQIVSSIKKIA